MEILFCSILVYLNFQNCRHLMTEILESLLILLHEDKNQDNTTMNNVKPDHILVFWPAKLPIFSY